MTPEGYASEFPVPVTPLIGREQEVRAIAGLLERDGVRLVTLTGPGGIGKTRLALAVATDVAGRYRDGIVFVSLAPVRDPARLLPVLAKSAHVIESAGRSTRDG